MIIFYMATNSGQSLYLDIFGILRCYFQSVLRKPLNCLIPESLLSPSARTGVALKPFANSKKICIPPRARYNDSAGLCSNTSRLNSVFINGFLKMLY